MNKLDEAIKRRRIERNVHRLSHVKYFIADEEVSQAVVIAVIGLPNFDALFFEYMSNLDAYAVGIELHNKETLELREEDFPND